METTEEIVEMVRGLRGDLVDCACTAMSSAECSCCMTWPEDFAEPAADMIERLASERDAAVVERNEWMRRSENDKAHSDRLTQNLFDAVTERDDLQVILDRERARGKEHDARVGKLHDKTLTLCAKATARAEKLRKFVQQLECECDSYFSFTCERCVALRENNYD